MVLGPLVSAYSRSLAVAPLPTKSLLAAVIAIGGDAVAQLSDGGGAGEAKGLDVERAVAFGIFGASYTGAFQHHLCSASPAAEWVGWLGAAMERTLLNQLIIIPLLYLPYYFLVSGMVKGHSPRAIVASARRRYLPLLRRNWAFWVPVQFSFFTLVDPQHLVLATCLAGLAWNALLSSLTYRHPRRGAQPLVAN